MINYKIIENKSELVTHICYHVGFSVNVPYIIKQIEQIKDRRYYKKRKVSKRHRYNRFLNYRTIGISIEKYIKR